MGILETNQIGVRKGDWKLVVINGKPHLYNLENDIHEDFNLCENYPEIVQELIDAIRKEHVDNPEYPITLPY